MYQYCVCVYVRMPVCAPGCVRVYIWQYFLDCCCLSFCLCFCLSVSCGVDGLLVLRVCTVNKQTVAGQLRGRERENCEHLNFLFFFFSFVSSLF